MAANTGAWQDVTVSGLSRPTTGKIFSANLNIGTNASNNDAALSYMSITYVSNDTQATI